MAKMQKQQHALLLPFPVQGHINGFAQLSQVLIRRNFLITFVNTDFNHKRIKPVSTAQIRFVSFPDGLPLHHERAQNLPEFIDVVLKTAPPHIDALIKNSDPPVDVMIADPTCIFAQDIADAHAIPRVVFRTSSACGGSAYFHVRLLMEHAYIPLTGTARDNLEKPVTCIPGMECLRVKDLPSFLTRTDDTSNYLFKHFVEQSMRRDLERASMWLFNTWDELEAPVLAHLNAQLSDKVVAIGPLLLMQHKEEQEQEQEQHQNAKMAKEEQEQEQNQNAKMTMEESSSNSNSLWKEESACLEWLDKQRPGSVLYVSFGSMAVFNEQQLHELALGIEQSMCPFLWVLRKDMLQQQQEGELSSSSSSSMKLPLGFCDRTGERSYFVGWAPQWKVLKHPSVAAFLTHNGWNSTVESICAGVPMLCWPYFAEQQTNRRFVSAVWKVGWEIDENVTRNVVAEMVRNVLDPTDAQGCLLRENVCRLRDSALRAVSEGGSSHSNLNRLVDLVATGGCVATPENTHEP